MTYKILIDTLEDTEKTAYALATCLPNMGVIAFSGKMGAGKTTLIAKTIEALYLIDNLPPPIITSPTFSLVHEYDVKNRKIAHFDLFRLNNPNDVLNLGFDDYLDTALCFIEWSQNAAHYLDNVILKCNLNIENDRRILTIDTFKGYSLDIQKFNTCDI